jgi:hypothetical protein
MPRSRPEADTAVLRVPRTVGARPLLHALDTSYDGAIRATGITYAEPGAQRFSGALTAGAPLVVDVEGIPYRLPHVFRLSRTSDARPGISGSVMVCEGGVVGLAHFARGEGARFEREVYVVPLTSWFEGSRACERQSIRSSTGRSTTRPS